MQICQHKHASLFAGPVSEAEAPEYKEVVLNPVDLATIKKSIESGAIRYRTLQQQSNSRQRERVLGELKIPVMADPHHVDADPDQLFHLFADPDPTFLFDGYGSDFTLTCESGFRILQLGTTTE